MWCTNFSLTLQCQHISDDFRLFVPALKCYFPKTRKSQFSDEINGNLYVLCTHCKSNKSFCSRQINFISQNFIGKIKYFDTFLKVFIAFVISIHSKLFKYIKYKHIIRSLKEYLLQVIYHWNGCAKRKCLTLRRKEYFVILPSHCKSFGNVFST